MQAMNAFTLCGPSNAPDTICSAKLRLHCCCNSSQCVLLSAASTLQEPLPTDRMVRFSPPQVLTGLQAAQQLVAGRQCECELPLYTLSAMPSWGAASLCTGKPGSCPRAALSSGKKWPQLWLGCGSRLKLVTQLSVERCMAQMTRDWLSAAIQLPLAFKLHWNMGLRPASSSVQATVRVRQFLTWGCKVPQFCPELCWHIGLGPASSSVRGKQMYRRDSVKCEGKPYMSKRDALQFALISILHRDNAFRRAQNSDEVHA